jgi:hypothetical protein
LTGALLVLSFALLVVPAAQASPASHSVSRTVHHGWGWNLLHALWQLSQGTDPFAPQPTQGPTVDPNGLGIN